MIIDGVKRCCAFVALLTLLLGLGLALVPATAQAAEDSVTNLAVTYDIQGDGSIDVRYELDWQFGSTGRHGIDFGIATRERWDADTTQDVLYDVSDVRVSSPSGAPTAFTATPNERGSVGSLDLRIGDRDKTIDGTRATYVIEYDLRGALRTFDGAPEFFWDVTGDNYPDIDQFTVTVTSPEPVQRSRCLVGRDECGSDITAEGAAVLTGRDVQAGTVVSAVAALAPGSVTGAEPTLEGRRIEVPVLTGVTSDVEVSADGVTHVDQELTYLLPADAAENPPTLRWELPLRRPFSRSEDRVFRTKDLRVDGATSVERKPLTARERAQESQDETWRIVPDVDGDTARLRLTYDVEGAVSTEGDTAHLEWTLAPEQFGDAPGMDFTWTFPGEVKRATCMRWVFSERRDCSSVLDPVPAGATVSLQVAAGESRVAGGAWLRAELPAASVGNAEAFLAPGVRAAARRDLAYGIGGAAAATAGAAGLLAGLSRLRLGRDRRWAAVPPGVRDSAGGPVRTARRGDVVPVRFDEPECELTLAGMVLDGRASPRHTAALLVHMAVLGAVRVHSRPLTVVKITDAPLQEHVEKQLYKAATLREVPLERTLLQQMGSTVDSRQKALLADSDVFVPLRSTASVPLYRQPVVWGVLALILTFPVAWMFIPGWLGPQGFLVVVGAVAGSIIGLYLSVRRQPRRSLEPNGTALRDQVQGFRRFIATAETGQLNFEAEQDIYRRYLPWAVLFGLTKRWTAVCQELAAAGRIPEPDTSFWIGSPSPAALVGEFAAMRGPLRSAAPAPTPPPSSSSSSSGGFFSGGGSGGSSGFSGGSSGGGGGGGTSASSW